jgi:hypothetical protein
MKLINALQSKPTLLLILMIAIVSILIIGVVVVLLCRLANEKKVTEAALELRELRTVSEPDWFILTWRIAESYMQVRAFMRCWGMIRVRRKQRVN